MDYEKLYKEALERARQVHTTNVDENKKSTEYIFPELKESEDEEVRKSIIADIKTRLKGCTHTLDEYYEKQLAWLEKQKTLTSEEYKQGKEDVLWCIEQARKNAKDENEMGTCWFAEKWLEKQGKQNSVNKVIPKFNVGDWIIFYGDTLRISEIVEGCYRTVSTTGLHNSYNWNLDNTARLWTIADAKNGDVLVDNERPFIFKGFSDNEHPGNPVAYGGINVFDQFSHSNWDNRWTSNKDGVKPATQKERELLFQKMKEAGYEWNENTKELKRRSL